MTLPRAAPSWPRGKGWPESRISIESQHGHQKYNVILNPSLSSRVNSVKDLLLPSATQLAANPPSHSCATRARTTIQFTQAQYHEAYPACFVAMHARRAAPLLPPGAAPLTRSRFRKHHHTALHIDINRILGCKFPFENLLRQRILYLTLDRALQRPCAVYRIETCLGDFR